jgi:TAT (twin-arginine translocation) pathway signal sequence
MENDDRFPGSEQPNRRQFLLTAGSTVAAGVMAACAPARAATVVAAETAAPDTAVPAVEHRYGSWRSGELMIFNINSAPRKAVGGSNTALAPLAFHD